MTVDAPAFGNAWTRYGVAFPTVNAPTTVPIAKPRRDRNHVDAIFIAGGYTPASENPVRKRSRSAPANPSTTIKPAFAAAPRKAAAAKYQRDGKTSARLNSAAV